MTAGGVGVVAHGVNHGVGRPTSPVDAVYSEELLRQKAAAACKIINSRVLLALEDQAKAEKNLNRKKGHPKLKKLQPKFWKDPNVTNPNNRAYQGTTRGTNHKMQQAPRHAPHRRKRCPDPAFFKGCVDDMKEDFGAYIPTFNPTVSAAAPQDVRKSGHRLVPCTFRAHAASPK